MESFDRNLRKAASMITDSVQASHIASGGVPAPTVPLNMRKNTNPEVMKAFEILEPDSTIELLNMAKELKEAKGNLKAKIIEQARYEWRCCAEKILVSGKVSHGLPNPVGYYDDNGTGSGRYSEETILRRTLEMVALKVYVDIMRHSQHQTELLKEMKQIKDFNPEYVLDVIMESDIPVKGRRKLRKTVMQFMNAKPRNVDMDTTVEDMYYSEDGKHLSEEGDALPVKECNQDNPYPTRIGNLVMSKACVVEESDEEIIKGKGVLDESKWESAKKTVRGQKKQPGDFYAMVSHIYQNMGGRYKGSTKKAEPDVFDRLLEKAGVI